MKPTTLGLIVARAGSERMRGKNKAVLHGRPMVLYTIDAALASKLALPPHYIACSSDDPDILDFAAEAGCGVIVRPPELATATAEMDDVIRHALSLYPGYTHVMLLQATSPLRTADDIDHCLEHYDTVVSVVRNGAIYLMRTDAVGEYADYWEMPTDKSIDVDGLSDFHEAARLLALRDRGEAGRGCVTAIPIAFALWLFIIWLVYELVRVL